MKDSQGNLVLGRTRWRRFALLLVPSVVAIGAILVGIANGVIGAGFVISGQQFKVSADHLHGEGFKQYGDFDSSKTTPVIPVARSTIDDAELTNLCQSVVAQAPGIPKIVLRIEAGKAPGSPATAKNLSIGLTELSGNATFTNIKIGRDGGELSGDPLRNGTFGQSADVIDIDNLRQTAYDTSAGTFKLTGLSLRVLVAGDECF